MIRFLIAISIAVLICAWIAVFYRPENSYLNHWLLQWTGEPFLQLRNWWQLQYPLPEFVIFSLPGGLWVFGLSLMGWRLMVGKFHIFYLGLLSGLGFELVQILGLTDGTADYLDLLAVVIGFLSAMWCTTYWIPKAWRAHPGKWRYVAFFLIFFAAFGADVLA